jgi:hypothetical protein
MTYNRKAVGLTFSGALIAFVLTTSVNAQGTASAPQTAPSLSAAATPPPSPPAPLWSLGTLDFSGYIDVYYSYNARSNKEEQ